MDKFYYDIILTPIGTLLIKANSSAVVSLDLVSHAECPGAGNEITKQCKKELQEYFSKTRKHFDVAIEPNGTAFQMKSWQALQKIDYGKTASYSELAASINNPRAQRAVGLANNKNKLPILIPCHRVVGKNGSLTGFALGLDKKAWLLNHEQAGAQKTV